MANRLKNLKTNPTQNIDDLLNDIEIKNCLILGTHKQESVPVFPQTTQDKMRDLMGFVRRAEAGFMPSTDEAIDLIIRGEALFDEVCNLIEETETDKGLLSTEKGKTIERLNYTLALYIYIIKRYVLIPIFSDEERRQALAEKVETLPDDNIAKKCLFDLKDRGVFMPLDAFSLICPELLKMGKMTEQALHKTRYDLAYEESVFFEKETGGNEADMPTQRQKDYIRSRLGEDEGVGDNEKQN